jgi:hypothetical protein
VKGWEVDDLAARSRRTDTARDRIGGAGEWRFWIAHVLGLLEQEETIARLVRQARLSNPEAEALAPRRPCIRPGSI